MNLRDLEYLLAVYELKNFSKAAQKCFVSQPTLSGQLKKMEEDLGAPLMERSTRQVIFTELGEKVVEKAREVKITVDQIKMLAKQSRDPLQGDFHLGVIPTIGPFLLPLLMPLLNDALPKLNFYLYELQTERLIDKLLKGQLDAVILAKLDWNHPIQESFLYSEKFCLAVSSDDSIALKQKEVTPGVLKNQDVLMLEDGHCLRDQALGVCFSAGAKEDQRYQATSMDTLLHMVSTGTGMTLVPEMACQQSINGVTFLPFKEPSPSRDIVLLSRKSCVRQQALRRVVNVVKLAVDEESHK
ncbi:MAG: LysR family transcriptional regulator [Acidiferrobacterales bacterium]|nr:LysR family transcriptional regulator [Acidiferrobacterales bacterium]